MNEPFCAAPARCVQWRKSVMSKPVQIGAMRQQEFGGLPLAPITCAPECIRDVVLSGRRNAHKKLRHAGHESQGSGLPKHGSRTTLHQPTCGPPLPEGDGVSQWRATTNDPATCFDVRAMIEQDIEYGNVIGAGSPMKGRFRMAAYEGCVDIGARQDPFPHAGGVIRKVAGPVRGDVEERALSVDRGAHEVAVRLQRLLERVNVTASDRVDSGGGERLSFLGAHATSCYSDHGRQDGFFIPTARFDIWPKAPWRVGCVRPAQDC